MKLTAVIDLDLPDDMVKTIMATSGAANLLEAPSDRDCMVLLAAFRQLPLVLREFLLSPDHTPMPYHTPVRLSTPQSQVQIDLAIHTGEPPCRVSCPSPSRPKSRKRGNRG